MNTSGETCSQIPPRAGSSGKILVADVHRAQQTNEVKKLLQKKKTLLINVPPGCTSRVQLLDVSVNKPFKNAVKIQFEKHLQENLTMYSEGKISASERRVLLTTWVGNACDEVCSNKEMLQRSFKKCGINIKEDASENELVHIKGISEYVTLEADKEFHLDADEDNDSDEGDLEATDVEETVEK